MGKKHAKAKRAPRRIRLTDSLRQRLAPLKNFVPELARRSGLSYIRVYNIVNGRVKSISVSDYRRLLGEDPPFQEPDRVDAAFFRSLARLWLSLNADATQADLYREFFGPHHARRVDYRIFTGQIKTVSPRLVDMMLEKFADAGLTRPEVEQWIEELEDGAAPERVPYWRIRRLILPVAGAWPIPMHPLQPA